MHGIVPLEAFEASEVPVFAVGADGRVRYYNSATADLIGCDRLEAIGRPCWRFARLRAGNGAPHCSRDCPVMRGAHAGSFPEMHPVILPRPAREPIRFGLVSFLVPPPKNGRWAVMHMLEPSHELTSGVHPEINGPAVRRRIPAPAHLDRRLGLLTKREKEILGALAESLDVETIADQFCLSTWTVRNHVQHILRKLRLHRQVDAILMLLQKYPGARPQK